MVRAAYASGFNTLLVQVRGRGDDHPSDGLQEGSALAASGRAAFEGLPIDDWRLIVGRHR
jgi:hypothetical protein